MAPVSDNKDVHTSAEPHRRLSQNDVEKTTAMDAHVEDSMVSGYVDPTLQLDSTENARLLKKIHWR